MAITSSVQPESGRMVKAGFDFPHPFQPRFSKEGMNHIVQKRPGSDLDGLVRVWPNTSGLEASRCAVIIGPGFWQDATGPLPVSHFQTRFRSSTDVPDNIVQNQPGSDLVLADCVRLWPNGSSPKASRCARIIRPDSGQCFPADPDRRRIGSGMFTEKLLREKRFTVFKRFCIKHDFLLLLISGQLFSIFHSPAKQNILGKKTKTHNQQTCF